MKKGTEHRTTSPNACRQLLRQYTTYGGDCEDNRRRGKDLKSWEAVSKVMKTRHTVKDDPTNIVSEVCVDTRQVVAEASKYSSLRRRVEKA